MVVKVLPTPNPDESKKEFTQRFMSDPESAKEFSESTQRYAVALSAWEARSKNKQLIKEALNMPENEGADISWEMPICKVDGEERVITGIVLEPNTVDAQGDIVSPETIKEAAYNFLKRYNKQTQIGFMHKMFGDLGVSLVESWVAKSDQEMHDKHIKKGSWLMSIRVDANEKLWTKCKNGELTGFSIGGTAKVSD